ARRSGDPPRRRPGVAGVRPRGRRAGRADPPGDQPVRDPRPVRREPADRDRGRAAVRGASAGGARRGRGGAGTTAVSPLAPYRALFGARFRMLLQYRAAALGGLFTQIVFGLILIMIYEAFYRSSTAAVQPMAFGQVASYVWLGQALLMLLPGNV